MKTKIRWIFTGHWTEGDFLHPFLEQLQFLLQTTPICGTCCLSTILALFLSPLLPCLSCKQSFSIGVYNMIQTNTKNVLAAWRCFVFIEMLTCATIGEHARARAYAWVVSAEKCQTNIPRMSEESVALFCHIYFTNLPIFIPHIYNFSHHHFQYSRSFGSH